MARELQVLSPPAPGVLNVHLAPFFERLGRSGEISASERIALSESATSPRWYDKATCVVHEGQSGGVLSILCEGLAVSSRTLSTGQQQNLAIFVPGDILNHEEFLLNRPSASVWALTSMSVAHIPHSELASILEAHPGLARALWRDMAASTRVTQEWMVGMGRRSAYQRVAHFLCEVQTRFEAAGLATASECLFPLTQSELADTLGLSVVHVNRVLQQLRREALVQLSQSKLSVLDWSRLVRAGDFDASYLDLPQPA